MHEATQQRSRAPESVGPSPGGTSSLVSAQAAAALALARCGGGGRLVPTASAAPVRARNAPPYAVEEDGPRGGRRRAGLRARAATHTLTRVNADGTVEWQQVGGPLNGPVPGGLRQPGATRTSPTSADTTCRCSTRTAATCGRSAATARMRGSSTIRLDVLVDAQDRLFVCDTLNHRVQVLDTNGRPQHVDRPRRYGARAR